MEFGRQESGASKASTALDPTFDDSFDWRPPVLVPLVLFLAFLALCLTLDHGAILIFVLLLLPPCVLGLALVSTFKRRGRRVAFLPTFIAVICLGVALWYHNHEIRISVRWIVLGYHYRNALLAQPPPAKGELQHLEWDDYGTLTDSYPLYLVLDPRDELRGEAAKQSSGYFSGIPCYVRSISRMSRTWYIVSVGANNEWSTCYIKGGTPSAALSTPR